MGRCADLLAIVVVKHRGENGASSGLMSPYGSAEMEGTY